MVVVRSGHGCNNQSCVCTQARLIVS
jgi:hypothetical protein